ncbi:hypothetical protein C0W52_05075 [Photobacterium kishitanii]|uniref:HTH cro/C1-type domain-containing protein n=3 Tax=Photobacterium kishitanii TaxID=318456 RepID=A0AAX0YQ04_9GAMM|nr:hypothetical protein C0W70_21680 [Photobacterium kishitanii]PSX29380.1 hypothetical protein C0W52_05075 [Photobacterium kishitanii]PSX33771.1 hypothetical protein C0W39_08980 [Photobacterium kishitanii]PSX39113.1 hypothetical protein C0W53_21495 [Photobacterium kishitanii]
MNAYNILMLHNDRYNLRFLCINYLTNPIDYKNINHMNNISFDKKIKGSRIISNISQKKMAEKLGISRQTYIDIENGVRIPKADTIYKISVITNQSINYFFYDNTEIGDIDQISILLEQLPESKKKWFFAVLKKIIECEDLL